MRLGSTAELRAQAADMAKSQEAYVRGVSSWNFDVAALREQATLEGAAFFTFSPFFRFFLFCCGLAMLLCRCDMDGVWVTCVLLEISCCVLLCVCTYITCE